MKSFGEELVRFSLDRPWVVLTAMVGSTLVLLLLAALPTISPDTFHFLPPATIDTDPENMLPSDEPVRVAHNANKATFSLHDGIVVGVVNESHAQGVFNPVTLAKVHQLTNFAKGLEGVVAVDVMSPSTVDSISSAGPGTVRFQWLMDEPPTDQAAADDIRDRAMRIPFLRGTLFSEDGKALAIYVPLRDKHEAHEISVALHDEIDSFASGSEQFHIAGLPVAEDTFGIEMFKQMAIAAPVAMLVIFLLMWFFFRSLPIIVPPMIVAIVGAMSTMGLLVVTGNTIHIMSSMIPIFIMPIAVLDAIHIISDFFDRYPEYRDRRKTLQKVLAELFQPMLFTSLTTTVGFASLALTPIPPVQVFGLFVGFGVLMAWFWTITFVPAAIMLIPEDRLAKFGRRAAAANADTGPDALGRFLARFTARRSRSIIAVTVALACVAIWGISKIEVNDNPTRWFEQDHPIRVADRAMNAHFGGTYNAYLALKYEPPTYSAKSFAAEFTGGAQRAREQLNGVVKRVQQHLAAQGPAPELELLDDIDGWVRQRRLDATGAEARAAWTALQGWLDGAFAEAEEAKAPAKDGRHALGNSLSTHAARSSEAFGRLNAFLEEVAGGAPANREEFVAGLTRKIEATAGDGPAWQAVQAVVAAALQGNEVFKDPALLQWISELQSALAKHDVVGKSNSLADITKTVHRDLLSGGPGDYRIPANRDTVAQVLEQYMSSHRKDDLWHFVTPDYQQANIWIQLKSGDNRDMQDVVAYVSKYLAAHSAPLAIATPEWFGLTYINVVWQEKMVSGMLHAFLGSFIVVLLMMIFLFRSISWGVLSMLPLTLTVGLIYGVIGLIGKDYDMPVAVLSSLSLGLAIDYAIHFLARARQLYREHGDWDKACEKVFGEPARAITRNIVVVGLGFLPLILAPLVPYQTVGFLIASILLLAGAASLLLLPALINPCQRLLFADTVPKARKVEKHSNTPRTQP